SQPLREAGLLATRRDGTRTLLRAEPSVDPVVQAAFESGRAACLSDGSLAEIPALLAQREEASRQFFSRAAAAPPEVDRPGGPAWVPFRRSWRRSSLGARWPSTW